MKSEKGISLFKLVLIVIVLLLLLGVTAHVAFQEGGVVSREEQNFINTVNSKTTKTYVKNQNDLNNVE